MKAAREMLLDRVPNVGSRDTAPCADLRGEQYKAALSGPVKTYKAFEELLPGRHALNDGMFVTICVGNYRCLYLNPQAVAWILERSQTIRIKADNINHRLILEPDSDGPWKVSRLRKRAKLASGGEVGGKALQRKLLQRGFKPGRYRARVEGNALVIDCDKQLKE